MSDQKLKIGISVGDINGIGVEVILKTFSDKRMLDFCTPVIFGSNKMIAFYKKSLNLNVQTHQISSLSQIEDEKLNVFNVWNEELKIEPGISNVNGGAYALKSLEALVKGVHAGAINAIVTAPINKENIQSEDFQFAGHTEFLDASFDGRSLMILMTNKLRVGLVTGHIPVSEISNAITPEIIKSKVNLLYTSLVKDFKISKPKIAVLGLNPHCGDNGVIGKEDDEIIRPTVEILREDGKLVYGPYAADGFFGSKSYEQFDAVLAMYHDQGLAPFKSLSFGKGVNFTAGLSVVRTSPDHGTAFEIAGKGQADEQSFKEALFSAITITKNRLEYKDLTKNPLKTTTTE